MTEPAALFDAFFREYFALDPVHASDAGEHAHDDRWPEVGESGRQARLAFADRWTERLETLPAQGLSADDRADRDVLLGQLASMRFGDTELREEAWSPLAWVELAGSGLFLLLAREFAPLPSRLASVAARLEGLPAVFDAARATLTGVGDRPVSRLHTEAAIEQLPGVGSLIDDALAQAEADPAAAAVLARLHAAASTARAAIAAFETHLRDTVLPASEGDGRLGADLFRAKLAHNLKDPAMTPDAVRERAAREYPLVRAEMVRIARSVWSTWRPGEPSPDDEQALVRGVLDAVVAEHPPADGLVDACRDELARINAFCAETGLIGVPDEPLRISWTPEFLRAFGGASLWTPGPLDRHLAADFFITPIPDDWTAEQGESWLREMNDRQIRLLTIHEAVPGHYLQGVYGNRNPSLARGVFWSGVFAEGWAVYVTQVMVDAGYGADDPALALVHWKFYLRAVINAILDVGVHVDGMGEDEAVALMVEGGFQEDAEARNKYRRARLTSTQLSTYFVGSIGFWDLELEARRRAAARRDDPDGSRAVPNPPLVGNFGATPDFDHRAHLEACIAHGAPPLPLLRELVLG